jgi:sugar lactone lactonase YvrE
MYGSAGSADEQLNDPQLACFARRGGVDTLLVCDSGNHRVVEVSADGRFLRHIAVEAGGGPYGVAYCGQRDAIAVSLHRAHVLVLLRYKTGAVLTTIGELWVRGASDGQLFGPIGLRFTADGARIVVADYYNYRVSMFSADDGTFIAHVATRANGTRPLSHPHDVWSCKDDDSVLVAEDRRVVRIRKDGTVKVVLDDCVPSSISYSPVLHGNVVTTRKGCVLLIRDEWMSSLRCAWVCASVL